MGTHLKYSVNTTLCREDDLEATQRSQNINVTLDSNGIVLFSEEGKRLTDYLFSNSVIIVFIVFLI